MQTFEAVAKGPKWANSVFVANFDEWTGFFENVALPRATAANQADTDVAERRGSAGETIPRFLNPVRVLSYSPPV
jgi:phospholipase C